MATNRVQFQAWRHGASFLCPSFKGKREILRLVSGTRSQIGWAGLRHAPRPLLLLVVVFSSQAKLAVVFSLLFLFFKQTCGLKSKKTP